MRIRRNKVVLFCATAVATIGAGLPSPTFDDRMRRVQATDSSTSALRLLYEHLGGPNWAKKQDWVELSNPCGAGSDGNHDWYGVTCQGWTGTEFQGVKELVLPDNGLIGALPTEIGILSNMVFRLDLSENALQNTLPSEIGKLSHLTTQMELGGNRFQGTIPTEIGLLEKLEFGLFLQRNLFSGHIPTQLGNLHRISDYLDLRANSLCGHIPTEVSVLKPKHLFLQEGNNLEQPCYGEDSAGFPSIKPTSRPTPRPTAIPSVRTMSLEPPPSPSYASTSLEPSPLPARIYDGEPSKNPSMPPTKLDGGGSVQPTASPTSRSDNPAKGSRAPTSSVGGFCNAGDYYVSSKDICVKCPAGYYNPEVSMATECLACPKNTYALLSPNSNLGSVECVGCPRGTTAEPASKSANDCVTDPGWWRSAAQKDAAAAGGGTPGSSIDTAAHRCPLGEACVGADQCLEGSTGRKCVRCEFGYGKNMQGFCESCPDHRQSILLITAMTLLYGLVVLASRRSTSNVTPLQFLIACLRRTNISTYVRESGNRLMTRAKICVNVFQAEALAIAAMYGIVPQVISGHAGPAIISSFDMFARLDCLDPRLSFYNRYAAGVFSPFSYSAGVLLLSATVLRLPGDASAEAVDRRNSTISNLLLSVVFYFYLGGSSLAMQYFVCDEVEGAYFLRADPRVKCTDLAYRSFGIVAYVVMFLVPIGGVLVLVWLLSGEELYARAARDDWRPPARQTAATFPEATGYRMQPEDEELEDPGDIEMERIFHAPALGLQIFSSPGPSEEGKNDSGREVANPIIEGAVSSDRHSRNSSSTGGRTDAHVGVASPLMNAAAAETTLHSNSGATRHDFGGRSSVANPFISAAAAKADPRVERTKGIEERPDEKASTQAPRRQDRQIEEPPGAESLSMTVDNDVDLNDDRSSLLPRREVSWRDFSAEIDASRRHEMRRENKVEETLAFIVNDFRAAWFKFEIFDCGRKLALCVIFVAAPWNPREKMLGGVFITASKLVLLGVGQPYVTLRDNFFASAGQLTIICFLASLLAMDGSTDGDRGAKVLLLPNLAFVATFFFLELTEQSSGASAGRYRQLSVVDAHDEEPDEEGESGNLEGSTDDFKMQQPRISRRELQAEFDGGGATSPLVDVSGPTSMNTTVSTKRSDTRYSRMGTANPFSTPPTLDEEGP